MTKKFSIGYKERMVERMIGVHAVTARQLSRESGLSQTTLSRWRQEARRLPLMPPSEKSSRSKVWSVEEKVRVLAAAAPLTGEELAAFLAKEGLLLAELEHWRMALDVEGVGSKETRKPSVITQNRPLKIT